MDVEEMFILKKSVYLCLVALSISPLHLFANTKITVWEHAVNDPTEIIMDLLQRALEISKTEYGDYQ